MNLFGQSSLLVTSTLYHNKEMFADTELFLDTKGMRPWLAFRLLLSKFVHEPKGRTSDDLLALNILKEKFDLLIELKMMRINPYQQNTIKYIVILLNKSLTAPIENLALQAHEILLPPHEYFGHTRKRDLVFNLKYRRRPVRKHSEKYIGVGYKDKGSSRKEHLDGTPSWQLTVAEEEDNLKRLQIQNMNLVKNPKFIQYSTRKIVEREYSRDDYQRFKVYTFDSDEIMWISTSDYMGALHSPIVSNELKTIALTFCRKKKGIGKREHYIPILYNGHEGFIVPKDKSKFHSIGR